MLYVIRGIGLGRTLQPLGGQVNVLQILEVFENRFTRVEGLGATGLFGQSLEAFFDLGIESYSEHEITIGLLYVYSKSRIQTPQVEVAV
jgi:hypothetical protein